MRQIATLPDAIQARTLADYLLTLRIETRVEERPEGWELWVCDEDQVPKARTELDTFQKEPQAERYTNAPRAADAIRSQEDEIEEDYGRRLTELRELIAEPNKSRFGRPVTFVLAGIAVVLAMATSFGEPASQPVLQALFIAPFHVEEVSGKGTMIFWSGLDRIAEGQVWRLITPVFIHSGIIHLLFGILILHDLGGAFEERRGSWRLLLFFLFAAALSNLAEYYLGWVAHFAAWSQRVPSPQFGGLSGVNYALFGYVWMKSRFESSSGFVMPLNLVILMVGWFLLCFSGTMGPIANVAHGAGLAVGVAVGVAPTLWKRPRG